jgi:hypothetical protein
LLPALDGTYALAEIGSNFFPRSEDLRRGQRSVHERVSFISAFNYIRPLKRYINPLK